MTNTCFVLELDYTDLRSTHHNDYFNIFIGVTKDDPSTKEKMTEFISKCSERINYEVFILDSDMKKIIESLLSNVTIIDGLKHYESISNENFSLTVEEVNYV